MTRLLLITCFYFQTFVPLSLLLPPVPSASMFGPYCVPVSLLGTAAAAAGVTQVCLVGCPGKRSAGKSSRGAVEPASCAGRRPA